MVLFHLKCQYSATSGRINHARFYSPLVLFLSEFEHDHAYYVCLRAFLSLSIEVSITVAFLELNLDELILVQVDPAHRSHIIAYGSLLKDYSR